MTNTAAKTFEDMMIAEMRANDGRVTTGPLAGHPLLILTTTGARSGAARQSILTWTSDGGDYIVAGTAGGSPTTPSWVANIRRNGDVTIEVGNRSMPATARIVEDRAERDRLWEQHVAELPWFGEYPKKTDRVFPIVRITPRG
jgi:deazaflavin-dependent oxidoreductase (nitroreductase family)